MFKHYYSFMVFVIPAFLLPIGLNWAAGLLYAIIIWYFIEKREYIKKINELENEACNELGKIISQIKGLNFNIIERLSFPTIDEDEKECILTENLVIFEDIFDKERTILDSIHGIKYLTHNSGWFFAKSYDYSYISHQISLIDSLDIYSFYLKYKDIRVVEDIKQYREDWIHLYTH